MSTPDGKSINPEGIVGRLKNILIKLQQDHNKVNFTYGKVHRTYNESIAIGHSRFSAWWRKSTFQSLLSKTIERCFGVLDAFKTNVLGLKPETAANLYSDEGRDSVPCARNYNQ